MTVLQIFTVNTDLDIRINVVDNSALIMRLFVSVTEILPASLSNQSNISLIFSGSMIVSVTSVVRATLDVGSINIMGSAAPK